MSKLDNNADFGLIVVVCNVTLIVSSFTDRLYQVLVCLSFGCIERLLSFHLILFRCIYCGVLTLCEALYTEYVCRAYMLLKEIDQG